ncbi:hypothetical protein OpiT1DRAFT_01867 [Opitutaceae bacterium TAV1]|nr:hypothetical protein OpiT1DRAFT_01867 [Opitutaceae bacterium TAV1]
MIPENQETNLAPHPTFPMRHPLPRFLISLGVFLLVVKMAHATGSDADNPTVFASRFVVLIRDTDPQVAMRPAGVKAVSYNVPTWLAHDKGRSDYAAVQRDAAVAGDGFDDSILDAAADGRTANLFAAGEVVSLRATRSTTGADGITRWEFPEDPRFTLTATLTPPASGTAESLPLLTFTLVSKIGAYFSVGYTGAPRVESADLAEIWQPLIWTEKRVPDRSFLTPAYLCPLPAALVRHKDGRTTGVIAEPDELPFQPLPAFANSRFGIATRDRDGAFRGMLFAPVLGGPGSHRSPGEAFTFKVRLVEARAPIPDVFEHLARDLYGFRDFRHNAIGSLNTTLDNMLAYGLSQWSWFVRELKGCAYSTDVPGAVKNVSSLNPINMAIVADDRRAFDEIGYPIAEFMLSREKTLFSLDPDQKIQNPSRALKGPATTASELAALYGLSGGRSPALLHLAGQVAARGGPAGDWRQMLAFWENTGDRIFLDKAVRGADTYLERRYTKPATSFIDRDAGELFFWTSHAPHWIELVRLHEATGDRRYLDAAREGARRFAMYIWMCPRVPDEEITVNEGGLAPMYWYLRRKGHEQMQAPEERVPAWRLSEIGLTPESSGTSAGHRAIFMANHAPWMLRIAALTGDTFLHDIARSAIIGRYLNFPGYHINTARTTIYEKADYPLRPHRELSVNSFHYNHIWPHMSILLDYLVTDVRARSGDRVVFPSRYIEGYAYLKSQFVGDRVGKFYSLPEAWLWMPPGLVKTEGTVELNHLSVRTGHAIGIAFTNESGSPVRATAVIDPARVSGLSGTTLQAEHWINNASSRSLAVRDGRLALDVPARGIVAVVIPGVTPRPGFARDLQTAATTPPAPGSVWENDYVEDKTGGLRALVLDFGKNLTTLFAYLQEDDSQVKEATLTVTFPDDKNRETQRLADSSYPWEFTLPLSGDVGRVDLRLTVIRPDGATETGQTVTLSR